MEIIITGTGVELTSPLKRYVEDKIGGLVKFAPALLQARVELELTTKHHHKSGSLFRAEGNMRGPGRLYRAEAAAQDLYAAIDALRDELKHELVRFKQKRIRLARRSSPRRAAGDAE